MASNISRTIELGLQSCWPLCKACTIVEACGSGFCRSIPMVPYVAATLWVLGVSRVMAVALVYRRSDDDVYRKSTGRVLAET
jgi:hypothetical protein